MEVEIRRHPENYLVPLPADGQGRRRRRPKRQGVEGREGSRRSRRSARQETAGARGLLGLAPGHGVWSRNTGSEAGASRHIVSAATWRQQQRKLVMITTKGQRRPVLLRFAGCGR